MNMPEVWREKARDDGAFTGPRILVEPFIQGEYMKFNSNLGWADGRYEVIQALSHFTYHHSKGKYLLCDLQGGEYDNHYILTDPVV